MVLYLIAEKDVVEALWVHGGKLGRGNGSMKKNKGKLKNKDKRKGKGGSANNKHTTNNINTSFVEKEETNGRAKNSK